MKGKIGVAFLSEAEIEQLMREDLDVEIEKLKKKVTGLRLLIRSIRASLRVVACQCETMPDGVSCTRCFYMGIIDKGLAKIAEERDE